MIPSLARDPATSVVRELRAEAVVEDERARERIRAREAEAGARIGTAERYELYGAKPALAVSPEVAELLYALVRARRPALVVEFGTSLGISAIALGSALADNGGGRLVTTELLEEKARRAREHLARAGVGGIANVVTGDARETLAAVEGPIDVLFLDGRNDLYLEILRLLEPQLAPGALVLADLSAGDPDLVPYLEHMRGGESAYTSHPMFGESGLEVSVRS